MSGYELPSAKGAGKEVISYWGQLWRPMAENVHGEINTSPAFATQTELTAWVRLARRDGDEVSTWKRTSRPDAGTFEDDALVAYEDVPADPQRLALIIRDLAEILTTEDRPKRAALAAKVRGPNAPTDSQRADVHELVDGLKTHLKDRSRVLDRRITRPGDRAGVISEHFDALTPMLAYDEVYAPGPNLDNILIEADDTL